MNEIIVFGIAVIVVDLAVVVVAVIGIVVIVIGWTKRLIFDDDILIFILLHCTAVTRYDCRHCIVAVE